MTGTALWSLSDGVGRRHMAMHISLRLSLPVMTYNITRRMPHVLVDLAAEIVS
jgi:hypothetical protein